MTSYTKKVMAGAAALGLCLTVTACSNSESDSAGSSASSVASSAASEASSAVSSASSVASSAASEASSADADDDDADDADDADDNKASSAEMTEVTTKDGTKQEIPADVTALAAKRTDLRSQDPQTVVVDDGKYLVNYGTIAGGYQYNVAWTEETGAVEIYGEIFNAWREAGDFDSEVGAPKAPEVEIDNGYSQDFTDGTITWTTEDGTNYSATVTER